jgi:hypothetical protein
MLAVSMLTEDLWLEVVRGAEKIKKAPKKMEGWEQMPATLQSCQRSALHIYYRFIH